MSFILWLQNGQPCLFLHLKPYSIGSVRGLWCIWIYSVKEFSVKAVLKHGGQFNFGTLCKICKKTEKKLMLGEVEEDLVGEDRQLGLDKLTEVRIG